MQINGFRDEGAETAAQDQDQDQAEVQEKTNSASFFRTMARKVTEKAARTRQAWADEMAAGRKDGNWPKARMESEIAAE